MESGKDNVIRIWNSMRERSLNNNSRNILIWGTEVYVISGHDFIHPRLCSLLGNKLCMHL